MDQSISRNDYFGGDLGRSQLRTRANQYDIGVRFTSANGVFSRTQIVTFTPRFVLVNQTSHCLLAKRVIPTPPSSSRDSGLVISVVEPGQFCSLQRKSTSTGGGRASISHTSLARLGFAGYDWSGPFPINQVGEVSVMCSLASREREQQKAATRGSDNAVALGPPPVRLTRVRIKLDKATLYIVCSDEPLLRPTYRIDNKSERTLFFRQKNELGTRRGKCGSRHGRCEGRLRVLRARLVLLGSWPKYPVRLARPSFTKATSLDISHVTAGKRCVSDHG